MYASAGLNGRGDAYLLDCPVLSQIDADGDGSFERERKYLQNSRGDVIGVQELDRYTPDECIRYTVYGYPELIPQPDPYHSADFNGDGDVGTDPDIAAFWACMGGVCCPTCGSRDVNRDGDVGTDPDIYAFYDILNGNIATPPPSLSDNRFGFRGYWWDDHLKLYHVRHRVYDPVSFRWLQPDPAGFVDGMNLYAYCGGDPINGIDEDGQFLHIIAGAVIGAAVGGVTSWINGDSIVKGIVSGGVFGTIVAVAPNAVNFLTPSDG